MYKNKNNFFIYFLYMRNLSFNQIVLIYFKKIF